MSAPVSSSRLYAEVEQETFQQKFATLVLMHCDVTRDLDQWSQQLDQDTVAYFLYATFVAKYSAVCGASGKEVNLELLFGTISTPSILSHYLRNIFKYATTLCSIKGNEVVIEGEGALENVKKLIKCTKNTVQRENIRNLVGCLLQYNFYFPTLESVQAQIEDRLQAQQLEPQPEEESLSVSGLATIDLSEGAQGEYDPEEQEKEWEGAYGEANILGQQEPSLINHEEEGEFDLSSLQFTAEYKQSVRDKTTEIEGYEVDLENNSQTNNLSA
ncbi:hypothetical protein CYMTET_14144 [Cymbomonas tetramitiformis]|uniref:Uncharacterized protein n=1 Tax=Cymbomonas tetramitiformis TaxID=36881 RepID=A0AAE0GH79_9CHLO|nr:hypothetical protein CYMTET_14144 [Cymbomonas tetramitiformis]